MIGFSISSELTKEVFLTILGFLSWSVVGSGRSFSSFLIPELQSPDSVIPVTLYEASWIASIVSFSTPIGCIISGAIQDTLGRKIGIQSPFIPFSIAWALISFSNNLYMIYIGMCLNGLGTGMSFGSIVYVGEISSPNRRGTLGSLLLTMFSLGILINYILMYLFTWRICATCFMVLSITSFVVLFFLPESPVWLIMCGKSEEAYKVLLWLRDSQSDADKNLQEAQRQSTAKEANNNKKNFKDVLMELYSIKKALIIILTLAIVQQLGGFIIMMSYSKLFFSSLEIPFDSSSASIIFAIDFFIISFLFPVIIEMMTRRTAQITAGTALLCCWLIVIVYEILYLQSEDKPFYWVILVTIFISVIPASFLCLCFPITMFGEIIPADKKGICVGILGFCVYMSGAVITKLYPLILSSYGMITTIGVFAFFSAINIPYGIFILPETHGKSLEEIQEQ